MYTKFEYDNRLRLLINPMPHIRSVSIIIFIGAGGCYETEVESGISHFVEHLCFRGTDKRKSSLEITEAIESVGGIINAGTDKEVTTYWCTVASQYTDIAIDVLADVVRNARFDLTDIEKERRIILEEIHMSLDSPRQRVDMLMDELLWPDKPLGRDVAGNEASVTAINRNQILDFVTRHYQPNNTVISVAGDIDIDHIKDGIASALGDWKQNHSSDIFTSAGVQVASRLKVEYRDIEQVHLCLGVPGVSVFDKDRFSTDLLSIILGEGMSSRLFLELREKYGLAYDLHSCSDHYHDSGAFVVYAGVDPSKKKKALTVMLDQLAALREGLSEVELKKAKSLAKGRMLLSLESSRNVAGWFGAQELLINKIYSLDEVIAMVEAVTIEDTRRIAQQLFRRECLNLAVVGPVKNREVFEQLLHNKM